MFFKFMRNFSELSLSDGDEILVADMNLREAITLRLRFPSEMLNA